MRNYSKETEMIIENNERLGVKPALLLHCCCAPCSSYCIDYLHKYFKITLFYYNPNIYPPEEYQHRVNEVRRLVNEMGLTDEVSVIEGENNSEVFYNAVRGMEHVPEGRERCFVCYELRLRETAKLAREMGFDYFTTTLSISPLKNAAKINETGEMLADEYGVKHLPSDFKKKNGYKRSVELSKQYNLYRQDYCGCVYSRR